MVERTGFKKFKALAFRSEISLIPLIPDGNLHNQTAMQEDCSLIAEIAI